MSTALQTYRIAAQHIRYIKNLDLHTRVFEQMIQNGADMSVASRWWHTNVEHLDDWMVNYPNPLDAFEACDAIVRDFCRLFPEDEETANLKNWLLQTDGFWERLAGDVAEEDITYNIKQEQHKYMLQQGLL